MDTYGLIGYPLGHSFSKHYFEQKFEKEHIAANFLNFELEDLSHLREILQNTPQLKGCSVTIPYKEKIIPLLDEIDTKAATIGAVNAIKVSLKQNHISLKGYNTDYWGFGKSLDNFIGSYSPAHALILGTGGASKAIAYALAERNISFTKVSRTPQEQEITYQDIDLSKYALIINTTPLGTFPNTENLPSIPYEQLTASHYLFDLVYNPTLTSFLSQGKMRQSHIQNGLPMLHYQAEYAWDLWNK